MTAIVTDAHYRMSVSLIRDLFDRGVRVAACEKASIEAPVGFASRGAAQCVRLPDEEYEAALLALCREILEAEGEKPVLLPVAGSLRHGAGSDGLVQHRLAVHLAVQLHPAQHPARRR